MGWGLDWRTFPDEDIEGLYWIRWKGKMTQIKWHATWTGDWTLCDVRVVPGYRLYEGRQPARCAHCLRKVAALRP